jgi:hypothetical protein
LNESLHHSFFVIVARVLGDFLLGISLTLKKNDINNTNTTFDDDVTNRATLQRMALRGYRVRARGYRVQPAGGFESSTTDSSFIVIIIFFIFFFGTFCYEKQSIERDAFSESGDRGSGRVFDERIVATWIVGDVDAGVELHRVSDWFVSNRERLLRGEDADSRERYIIL